MQEEHRVFMRKAIELSEKAAFHEKSGGCFGAVVVKDGKVIGEGFNQVFRACDPTWHAEVQAIREACKQQGTPNLSGAIVYSSTIPCIMCTAACYWAKVARVFYAADDADVAEFDIKETEGDVFHEAEYKLPAGERKGIVFEQLMRDEAREVFKRYAALPASSKHTPY